MLFEIHFGNTSTMSWWTTTMEPTGSGLPGGRFRGRYRVFFCFFFLFHRILARRGDPIGGVQWSLNQSRPSTTPLVRADGRPIRIRCHQNGGLPLKTDLREPANVVALDEFPLSKVLTEESFHLERFVETNDYRQRSRNPFRVERSRSS